MPLNSHSDEFRVVNVSGPNVKAQVDKAVANYVGTYLKETSNKSGFNGEVENDENYTEIMGLAKYIHEELLNITKL